MPISTAKVFSREMLRKTAENEGAKKKVVDGCWKAVSSGGMENAKRHGRGQNARNVWRVVWGGVRAEKITGDEYPALMPPRERWVAIAAWHARRACDPCAYGIGSGVRGPLRALPLPGERVWAVRPDGTLAEVDAPPAVEREIADGAAAGEMRLGGVVYVWG